ncbi:MAG: polyprenyl synthetase family protein [Bacteroidota bacterium]|nr:polyprenyl synthetase family protein [Bacteroidota bacterium]
MLLNKHPLDWPAEGKRLDIEKHDLPHRSSSIEWWYMHAHLDGKNEKGEPRKLAMFASFFLRLLEIDTKTGLPNYAYSLTWAISDLDNKTYHPISLVDKQAPKIGLERLQKGDVVRDPYLKKAALEVVKRGKVPFPDEMFTGEAGLSWEALDINYDGNRFTKEDDASYTLQCDHSLKQQGIQLNFSPRCAPCLHGDKGVVAGVKSEDMFYYFIPKNDAKGKVFLQHEVIEVKGSLWYDHEFGCYPQGNKRTSKADVGWNWIAIQFDHGEQVTAYDLRIDKTGSSKGAYLVAVDKEGKQQTSNEFSLTPKNNKRWTSLRTFNEYPTHWKLYCESLDLKVEASAVFDAQEFGTLLSKPAFWEGRLDVKGWWKGKDVTGKAYFERSGFHKNETLQDFFKAVSKETLKSVQYIIPRAMDTEKFQELVAVKGNTLWTQGVQRDIFYEALIKPIRTITDRGGKSWRSYATVACSDIVGGNAQLAKDWLALPELMHVGSLMVDDVQDKSALRRGGPAAHHMFGEAIAINSGSAAYFLGQICVYVADIDPELKMDIYHLYFEALRAAHTGQAMDLYGLDYLMDDVVENDKGKLLVQRVKAIHRLKSAAPASYLARIGAMLGGGSKEQIEGLANYFTALGLSFQIIDDTLNLKGFKDGLKTKGEDITAGKITYPMARAFSMLSKRARRELYSIIQSKTEDIEVIARAIALMDSCQAIDLAEKEARTSLEAAWRRLDPLVEDSMVKINLRAFSWYVLDRTY